MAHPRGTPIRRQALRLPKRRWHVLGAVGALAALLVLPVAITTVAGAETDARPGGTVEVAALDPASLPSPLDASATDLPDLLGDDVLMGDNPTLSIVTEVETDALGNAVDDAPASNAPDTSRTVTIPERAAAIDPSLTRDSAFGPIPGRNARGVAPLDRYRRAATLQPGKMPVSLVVGGLGINGPLTQRAIDELPADVTLSFAAHATGLQGWIDRARAAGHEVLLEIPMESAAFDPGEPGAERALRSDASVEANRRNLHSVLSRAQGYAGVINYNGDRVLTRSDLMAPVMGELGQSGLGVFSDGSFSAPSLPALARSLEVPYAAGFGLVDPEPDAAVITARLSELNAAAKARPGAFGVGFVYPQTIDAVKGWSATLSSEGLVLVPATAALR